MIKKILSLIEEFFPSSGTEVSQEVWDENISLVCKKILLFSNELFLITEKDLPDRIFKESKHEILSNLKPRLEIGTVRLRPASDYYSKFGLPIPLPENPTGKHATGIALNISFYRGSQSIPYPHLLIEFSVWGCRERIAFINFLNDHRRCVQMLVSGQDFEFATACCFDNVDKCRGYDVFKKLEIYSQIKEDPENNFSIIREFNSNSHFYEIVSAFIPLAILYDVSLGYCRHSKKYRDRIFEYRNNILKIS
jgi:hypothetical protein